MTQLSQLPAPALKDALKVCVLARRPAFTWGEPGIGKSDLHRQLAIDLGAKLIDIRASQLDAVDTRGVPYVADAETGKMTQWAIPAIFPTAEQAAQEDKIIVFLDELNAAPLSVQAALYQLVLDRQLGDYVLPENVFIMAAGNQETDRAVTSRMSTALSDRFFHFKLAVDNAAWERWALENDIHIAVISYLRYRPEHLHSFDPKSASKAQATPRGWEYVSDILKVTEAEGINGIVESALITGKIGEAVGAEFVGFLPLYRNLPDPAAILMDPDGAEISDDPSVNYALCGALAQRANQDNFDRVVRYAQRLGESQEAGPEFETVLIRTAAIRNPEVQHTKGFIQWSSDNEVTI